MDEVLYILSIPAVVLLFLWLLGVFRKRDPAGHKRGKRWAPGREEGKTQKRA